MYTFTSCYPIRQLLCQHLNDICFIHSAPDQAAVAFFLFPARRFLSFTFFHAFTKIFYSRVPSFMCLFFTLGFRSTSGRLNVKSYVFFPQLLFQSSTLNFRLLPPQSRL